MHAVVERGTPADFEEVSSLLTESRLPLDGLAPQLDTMLVVRESGRVVGCAALEIYADGALLRSVAVASACRGMGVGHRLTDAALALARERHVPAVYLLTTTAERFFPRFGFERITRAEVPSGVQSSVEFASACPASAIAMRRSLAIPHGR